jgi:sulfate adenylyltransferase
MTALVPPYGGVLVDLLAGPERERELRKQSADWLSVVLTPRQTCDLELLLSGGFSPLHGFLARADYEAVCATMRLADGTLWPIPVTLDVAARVASRLRPGQALALRDSEATLLAVLHVEDAWRPDREFEAEAVYGTADPSHPSVRQLRDQDGCWCVGGTIEGLRPPVHHDYRALRHTPRQLRAQFQRRGWRRIVAFQTRNPLHRAHQELTLRAAREAQAKLLIHPVVGMTKPGDVDHYTRVRCYRAAMASYPPGMVVFFLLPRAIRMPGPREALLHAIVRRNHGASHLVVGRDHASPGTDAAGRPFYGPYEAQELLRRHEQELGVRMVPYRQMVYVADSDSYLPEDEVPAGAQTMTISGTQQRRLLREGRPLPAWFTLPQIAEELGRRFPPPSRQGVVVFFTGLSGAGKSTIAAVLHARLLEWGGRTVTLLDGDVARTHLSSELGFSKEHRDLNVRRIGFVAAEVARHGGLAICAPIAPYDAARRLVRAMVEEVGHFMLVHVATPLAVCEQRDPKGLYARARAGTLPGFTGISDPYEPPADAELVLDTTSITAGQAAAAILRHLRREGYLPPDVGC